MRPPLLNARLDGVAECQVLACELDGARRELKVSVGSRLVLRVQ